MREALKKSAAPMSGVWLITWSNGGTFRYDFGKDGSSLTDGTFKTTKSERAGEARTYWVQGAGGNHVHRYCPGGEYLVVEFWQDPAAFERAEPPMAVGIAVRAK